MTHHLVIMYPHYVREIIAGRKTVECRMGSGNHAPHGEVEVGDLVWLKEVGGAIRATARVRGVQTIELSGPDSVDQLRQKWTDRIQAPLSFWHERLDARVATLIILGDVCSFRPFRVVKADRRAWVSLTCPPVPGKPLRAKPRKGITHSGDSGG